MTDSERAFMETCFVPEIVYTIEGMTSEDYKERFKAEYDQTNIRWRKLKAFCNKIEAAELTGAEPPKHDCPLGLLREQQAVMERYLRILEIRAEIEGVEISKR